MQRARALVQIRHPRWFWRQSTGTARRLPLPAIALGVAASPTRKNPLIKRSFSFLTLQSPRATRHCVWSALEPCRACTSDVTVTSGSSSSSEIGLLKKVIHREAILRCSGKNVGSLLDVLLSLGAVAASVEDAGVGTPEEQQIVVSGPALWDPKAERRMWDSSLVRVLFDAAWCNEKIRNTVEAARQVLAMSAEEEDEWDGENGGVPVEGAQLQGTSVQDQPEPGSRKSSDGHSGTFSEGGEAEAEEGEAAGITLQVVQIADVQDADWVKQVMDSFQPTMVEPGLWVLPPWTDPATLTDPPAPSAPTATPQASVPPSLAPVPAAVAEAEPQGAHRLALGGERLLPPLRVVVEPGLAFGTGEHPTTRLCLRWLRRHVGPGDTVLDYGTGSGVLAVAAIKLGASMAVGTDIDELAVSAASHNAELNGVVPGKDFTALCIDPDEDASSRIQRAVGAMCDAQGAAGLMGFGADDEPMQFDIVAANILVNPLVELAPSLANYTRPGGKLCLSGVLQSQVERVVSAFKGHASVVQVLEDNGWALLYLER